MPRLISALLVRNEAGPDRYLRRVLARCREFSDAIVVLDDRSTDLTARVCRGSGAIVKTRSVLDSQAWGAESAARAELWDLASEHCGPEDFILFCDADMLFYGNPRDLIQTREVNTWSVILYDLWDSEETYRADNFWRGHEFPRPWLVAPHRVPDGWKPEWGVRGIHCGHLPQNYPIIAGIAPIMTYYYCHLAYLSPEHRRAKHQQYLSKAHILSPFERAHAESILDDQAL